MNSNLLKVGAIGVGAYLLWPRVSQFVSEAKSGTASPATMMPAAQAGAAIAPAPASVSTNTPPPAPTPTPAVVNLLPVTDELIKHATYDRATAALLGNRVLLSVWQWNFYRSHNGVSPDMGSEDFSELGADPANPISAIQYQDLLRARGLGRVRGRR